MKAAGLCPNWKCCDKLIQRKRLYSTQMTQLTQLDVERRRSCTSQWSSNSKESLQLRLNGGTRLPRLDDENEVEEESGVGRTVGDGGCDDVGSRNSDCKDTSSDSSKEKLDCGDKILSLYLSPNHPQPSTLHKNGYIKVSTSETTSI